MNLSLDENVIDGESFQVRLANLENQLDQQAILELTNHYACDEMAGGSPLPQATIENLIQGLREHPTTIVFLAWLGEEAIGIATCFLGFSTFAAKSLINIHDLAVRREHQGKGVGRALLRAVELEAQRRGCVKLTLEVLENNRKARGLYESLGFAQAVYSSTSGGGLFYSKAVSSE